MFACVAAEAKALSFDSWFVSIIVVNTFAGDYGGATVA